MDCQEEEVIIPDQIEDVIMIDRTMPGPELEPELEPELNPELEPDLELEQASQQEAEPETQPEAVPCMITIAHVSSLGALSDLKFKKRLIAQVRNHRSLYDPKHKHFSNVEAKERNWMQIAEKLSSKVETCKNTWANLRVEYQNYVRKLRKFFRCGNNKRKRRPQMQLELEMLFLYRFVANRTICPLPYKEDDAGTNAAAVEEDDDVLILEVPTVVIDLDAEDDVQPKTRIGGSSFVITDEIRNLLKVIKEYPELYDTRDRYYTDFRRKGIIWNAIANELRDKATKLMKLWVYIQMRYEWLVKNQHQPFSKEDSNLELSALAAFLRTYIVADSYSVYKQSYYLKYGWHEPIEYFKSIYTLLGFIRKNPIVIEQTDRRLMKQGYLGDVAYCTQWRMIAKLMGSEPKNGQCETTWLLLHKFYWELLNMRKYNYQLQDKWYFESVITDMYNESKLMPKTNPYFPIKDQISIVQKRAKTTTVTTAGTITISTATTTVPANIATTKTATTTCHVSTTNASRIVLQTQKTLPMQVSKNPANTYQQQFVLNGQNNANNISSMSNNQLNMTMGMMPQQNNLPNVLPVMPINNVQPIATTQSILPNNMSIQQIQMPLPCLSLQQMQNMQPMQQQYTNMTSMPSLVPNFNKSVSTSAQIRPLNNANRSYISPQQQYSSLIMQQQQQQQQQQQSMTTQSQLNKLLVNSNLPSSLKIQAKITTKTTSSFNATTPPTATPMAPNFTNMPAANSVLQVRPIESMRAYNPQPPPLTPCAPIATNNFQAAQVTNGGMPTLIEKTFHNTPVAATIPSVSPQLQESQTHSRQTLATSTAVNTPNTVIPAKNVIKTKLPTTKQEPLPVSVHTADVTSSSQAEPMIRLPTMPITTSSNSKINTLPAMTNALPKALAPTSTTSSLLKSKEVMIAMENHPEGKQFVVHGPSLKVKHYLSMTKTANFIRTIMAIPLLHRKQNATESEINSYWSYVTKAFDLPRPICEAMWIYLYQNFNHLSQIAPMEKLMKPSKIGLNVWKESDSLFKKFDAYAAKVNLLIHRQQMPAIVSEIGKHRELYASNQSAPSREVTSAWNKVQAKFTKIAHLPEIWTSFNNVFVHYMKELEKGIDNKWPQNWWRVFMKMDFLLKEHYKNSDPFYYIIHNKMMDEIERCNMYELKMGLSTTEEQQQQQQQQAVPIAINVAADIQSTAQTFSSEIIDISEDEAEESMDFYGIDFDAQQLLMTIKSLPQIFTNCSSIEKHLAWQQVAETMDCSVKDCQENFKKILWNYRSLKILDPQQHCTINHKFYKQIDEIYCSVMNEPRSSISDDSEGFQDAYVADINRKITQPILVMQNLRNAYKMLPPNAQKSIEDKLEKVIDEFKKKKN